MKTEPDWRDVLLKAASIVEAGWCQGTMHCDEEGAPTYSSREPDQSCATGAMERAFDLLRADRYLDDSVFAAAGSGLGEHLDPKMEGKPWLSIAKWNDHPDRTALEVAEAMRQAASSPNDVAQIALTRLGRPGQITNAEGTT